jgi:hypothetical protein
MNHLQETGTTYLQHAQLAIFNSFRLFCASCILFIHALFPFLFTKTTSKIIDIVKNSFPKIGDQILVRFNTKWKDDPQHRQWRVLVNGKETLADCVIIKTLAITVEEPIAGEQKFHFNCHGKVTWQNDTAVID